VARQLRREPGLENALLVAVTGYGQDEDRRKAQEAGFDAHLVKPADPATLQRLLAQTGKAR
jgi:two-component system CheB/CheR fusion protein